MNDPVTVVKENLREYCVRDAEGAIHTVYGQWTETTFTHLNIMVGSLTGAKSCVASFRDPIAWVNVSFNDLAEETLEGENNHA